MGKVVIICFLMPQVLQRRQNVIAALMAHVVLFALYPARGGIFNRLAGKTDVGRWKWIYICNNPND